MLLKEIVLNGEIHLYDTQAYNNDKETFLIQSNLKKFHFCSYFVQIYILSMMPIVLPSGKFLRLSVFKNLVYWTIQRDNLKGRFKGTINFSQKYY